MKKIFLTICLCLLTVPVWGYPPTPIFDVTPYDANHDGIIDSIAGGFGQDMSTFTGVPNITLGVVAAIVLDTDMDAWLADATSAKLAATMTDEVGLGYFMRNDTTAMTTSVTLNNGFVFKPLASTAGHTFGAQAYGDAGEGVNLQNVFVCTNSATTLPTCTFDNVILELPVAKTLTPVIGDADLITPATYDWYGGTIIINATGTLELPAVVDGMHFVVLVEGAIAVDLNPDDTGTEDTIYLNGTEESQGENVDNGSTSGAVIACQYRSPDHWTCTGAAWSGE